MYGIFTYLWLIFMVNVGKYTLHGSYGLESLSVVYRSLLKVNGTSFDNYKSLNMM